MPISLSEKEQDEVSILLEKVCTCTETMAMVTTYRPEWEAKLVWNIDNATKTLRTGATVTSPTLYIRNKYLRGAFMSWAIQVKTNDGRLTVEPMIPSIDDDLMDCEYDIVLGDPSDKFSSIKSGKIKGRTCGTKSEVCLTKWCSLSDPFSLALEDVMNDKKFYPNDTLRITVNLCLSLDVTEKWEKTDVRPLPALEEPTSAAKWMAGLYNSSKHSDVIIKCQTEVFHSHMMILSQSSVFEKMLASPMTESRSKEIVISDVDPTDLELFLKSLYGVPFEVPDNCDELLGLINCAEKYNMLVLKDNCLQAMSKMLSDENAGELTLAAFRYSTNPDFQAHFKTYCQKNHHTLIQNPKYLDLYKKNLDAFL